MYPAVGSGFQPKGGLLTPYLAALESAIRAVQFLDDTQFTWFGAPSKALRPAIRGQLTPDTAKGFLRYQLQQTLYSQFYTKGIPSAYTDEARWTEGDAGFVAALSAANQGTGSEEAGWTVREIRAGRAVVCRGGLALEVAPQACVPPIAQTVESPIQVRLRVPNSKPNLSPGYYVIVGNTPLLQGDSLVRLYWHLTAQGAACWVRCATERLNACSLPFQLKVLCSPKYFGRCDAGVIYLPRSVFLGATQIVGEIHTRVESYLRRGVPAFTRFLAPGLAIAESPGGESFGLHRCELIAAGLVRSRMEGQTSDTDRVNTVLDCWTQAGLRIEKPYLNPGSENVYAPFCAPRSLGAAAPSQEISYNDMNPAAYLNFAVGVGHSLAAEALWDGERCTWVGAQVDQRGVTCYGTLSADLYSGTAGIGLFLAALWKVVRSEQIRRVAVGAIRQVLAGVDSLVKENPFGLYTGAVGVCWAAVGAGLALQEAALVESAVLKLRAFMQAKDGTISELVAQAKEDENAPKPKPPEAGK